MRNCQWCEEPSIPEDADPRRIYCPGNKCKMAAYRGRLFLKRSLVDRFKVYARTSPAAAEFLAMLESEGPPT